jgi:hypothetical protein
MVSTRFILSEFSCPRVHASADVLVDTWDARVQVCPRKSPRVGVLPPLHTSSSPRPDSPPNPTYPHTHACNVLRPPQAAVLASALPVRRARVYHQRPEPRE